MPCRGASRPAMPSSCSKRSDGGSKLGGFGFPSKNINNHIHHKYKSAENDQFRNQLQSHLIGDLKNFLSCTGRKVYWETESA